MRHARFMVLIGVAAVSWVLLATGSAPITPADGQQDGPPTIELTAGDRSITGVRGSYCWQDSSDRGLCVDTIGPADLIAHHDLSTVTISSSTDLLPMTTDHTEPAAYQYQFRANRTAITGGSVDSGDPIPLPEPGQYVLVVSARWPQGDVYYAFPLRVR